MGQGTSVDPNQSLKEGQNQSLRGLCEGRENRGAAPIREAPDSVRDLTRVQYPSRVSTKGYQGWLKAWAGRRLIVEVKPIPKRSKNRYS